MLKCRMVEERVRKNDPRLRIRGREAILVGGTIGLRADDYIADSRHALFVEIARGRPLDDVLEKIGRRNHPGRRKKKEFHLSRGAEFSIATGVALDFQLHKKHSVVMALAPETGESPDFWQETATYAALRKLPIIFVVKGGVSKADGRRLGREVDVGRAAEKCGLPGIPVDESDAVAVYRVAHEAIERARRGAGPALIECKRWIDASAADPIQHMHQYLEWKGLWSEEWRRQVSEDIRREIEGARRAKRSR